MHSPSARPSSLPYVQVSLAAIAWGTWSLFLRPAAVDPRWSSAIMLAVVTIAGAPLLLRRGARGPSPESLASHGPRRTIEWRYLAWMGVCDALNASLFFAALSVTTVAIAVLSHYLAPVFVAAFAPTVLRLPRERRALSLAFLALCGLALVLEPWQFGGNGSTGKTLLGAVLGAGSAVFYATNVLLTKRIGQRFTAEEQLVYHSILSVVLLVAAALVLRAPFPSTGGATRIALASVVLGALAGLLFLYGLRRMRAEHAGMLTFFEPLTAVIVAWIAWGERPGMLAMIGGAVVVLSGALAIASGVERRASTAA